LDPDSTKTNLWQSVCYPCCWTPNLYFLKPWSNFD